LPSKYVHTSVEGRALKLSNLNKILYPTRSISKAQVIQYYLDVAPLLLNYIKDRPLTVIRFPDGVDGKSFYSKDKPKWTPEWIDSMLIEHEEKTIDYLVPDTAASIVWLANLACLELHPTQFIKYNDLQPDFFVVDLDPDEGLDFAHVKQAALHLKVFLERYDYTPYLKTSGGKGLHIYVPIRPEVPYETLTASVKGLAKIFVSQYKALYTLNISKAQRKGKILIDIYRNHLSNTTVAPYSLRGKIGAPISMPIRWLDLEDLAESSKYTIENYRDYLDEHGDVWSDWRDHAVTLHDQRGDSSAKPNDDNRLQAYIEKRDFNNTAEPLASVSRQHKDLFVIQLHDASNLHYDLRLEDNGVLWSWAIPKGLPYAKGQKRLAIRTEDHPIKYLYFEGVIPKGQYGAGEMWIFRSGKIAWQKKSDASLHFTLDSGLDKRDFKLFRTGNEAQWLIECTDDYDYYGIKNEIAPMLASASRKIPKALHYEYEVKWDGIRVILYYQNDQIKIVSRGGRDITAQFPELQISDVCKVEHAVMDAEIVVLDEKGRPKFHDVISRMHSKGEHSIKSGMKSKPVTCYVFDLMSMDGQDIVQEPLSRRRAWLKTILRSGIYYRLSESFKDGDQLFKAIEKQDMEGIMAKDQKGIYRPGQRGDHWIKIKCRKLEQCMIIGYTHGQGDRSGLFGAMHLVQDGAEGYKYLGKVGTGFDHEKLKNLYAIMTSLPKIDKPIDHKIEEEHRTVWIEPRLSCEIEYASLSSNGTYREPVFIKLNEGQ